jgi:hypothetical protein
MIDATHLKGHRTAASLLKKGGYTPTYRTHQRRPELQTLRHLRRQGTALILLLSEGQLSDYKGAALMVDTLPKANVLLGDRSYDADQFSVSKVRLLSGGPVEFVGPSVDDGIAIDEVDS